MRGSAYGASGLVLLVGCVGPSTAAAPIQTVASAQVEPLVVSPTSAMPLGVLLERAELELEAGNARRAAALFRQAFDADPKGPRAADALLGEARARLVTEEPTLALERLRLLEQRFPQSPVRPRAQLLRALTLLQLERFSEAAAVARVLADPPRVPTLLEGLVVDATATLAELAAKTPEGLESADSRIRRARVVVDERRLDQAGTFTVELAAFFYAAGEVNARRAERIVFEPFPPTFGADLERRCELILDAQSAYSSVMRAKEPRFAAMAGLRIADLYEQLHADLMRVPRPQTDELKQQLFEGALRLRFALLLDKARTMLTHTLAMAQRASLKNQWVQRASAALARVDLQKQLESDAIAKLPFTRAQLQAKLAEILAEREASGASKGGASRGAAPQR